MSSSFENGIVRALVVVGFFVGSISAFAGTCHTVTHRDPCPGKTEKMLAPYKTATNPTGDPTVKDESADNEAACKTIAKNASTIIRKRDLAAKTVKASFDGKDVGEFSDKSDCK